MKIRSGFVSNSSSSSFVLYGASVDPDKLTETLLEDTTSSFNLSDSMKEMLEDEGFQEFSYNYDLEDIMNCDLSCESGYDDIYLGRTPQSLKDDETGKQFKDSVKQLLLQIFGQEIKCTWHEEVIEG